MMMGKKALDLEKMYQKIMPTYDSDTGDTPPVQEVASEQTVEAPRNAAFLQNITTKRIQDRDHRVIIENITERLVMTKLDMVLQKMSCCKCDRCKMDIAAKALNALQPQYVVASQNLIEKKLERIADDVFSQRVTNAVLKAALEVRKQPRH